MTANSWIQFTLSACLGLALAGCGGPAVKSPEEMNASYEQALARTAALAIELPGGDEGAQQVFARAESFLSDMRETAIREKTADIYAPEGYLNDSLAVVEGATAISDYFAGTAGRVRALKVSFLDITHRGPDYFVRWRMSVESPRLNDGAPMVSYGMSHFRFDAEGRILMHKDFWDAGTGLYEYLPVVGTVVQRVRATAQ